MKKLTKTLAVLGTAAAMTLAVSCSGGKNLTVAVSTLPDSLNPILEQNTSGLNVNELLFDGLTNFEVDETSGTLYTEFGLADEIIQEADKVTYTVTLKDVNWHDNTPVTAEDVVYSFKAYMLPANNSPKREYLNSFIKSVEAIDDTTVKIVFKKPIPEFRAYPILSFKIIPCRYNGEEMDVNMREGELERKFATDPIGTGPFKMAKWEIGKQIDFDANGLYFKSVPKATSLTIKRSIDPIVRMNELRKGKINVILETTPMDKAIVSNIKDVDINSYMPYAFYSVEINTKFFSKAEGRQAMAMALDKENLIPGVTDAASGVIINNGPYPTNLFRVNCPQYLNEDIPNLLPYNLTKAKRLAKTGEISGQNATLIFPDSMGEFGKSLAEGIAKQLGEIGLNVDVQRTGEQVFNRKVYKEKNYELALMYHEGFDNVYSTMANLYSTKGSENITGISDPTLNELFVKLDKEGLMENWIKLILQTNKRVTDLCPSLYLCSLEKDVYSKGLDNVLIASDNPFLSVEEWKFK